jgi:quinol monooxygenase YgiN
MPFIINPNFMICVIASIDTIPSGRKALLNAFKELAPKVRAEKGCIEYTPMIDLPTSLPSQKPVCENIVTIVEKWESTEALETHLMAQHMIDFRRATEHLRSGIELHILQPAE